MKIIYRVLLFVMLVATSINANAQFTLTYNGFVSTSVPSQDYIVLEFPSKSKFELYNLVSLYLHSIYISPNGVVSNLQYESITVNGITPNAIYIKKKRKRALDIDYSIHIVFKDGKIRINAPYIVGMHDYTRTSNYHFYLHGVWDPFYTGVYPFYDGVYRAKDGKLINRYAKESIELFFNSRITSLKHYLEGRSSIDNSDW